MLAQVPPAQQGSLSLPHSVHVPFSHTSGSPQYSPGQQGSPAPPQAMQLPFTHVVSGAVQETSLQQISPRPPQAPPADTHWLAMQAPPFGHGLPPPMHTGFCIE